ncbi:MAG: peptide-methionine (S)-S-oxide reductase MsrA [Ectothiorhodospiraceae bacterium AqS1]|nr:peptide-methionine (S)-S-oxide reductase MsrA [Ectothiorhodospiraceae bacterium AqS1]
MIFHWKRKEIPAADETLPGRAEPIPTAKSHFVNGRNLHPPTPDGWPGFERAIFGMGCFWGPERLLWTLPGMHITAVGYSGGHTPNPTYEEVCSGRTGHNEVVLAVFDPDRIKYRDLLELFWESHDPTQGMRQGVDIGTQYRSGIYTLSDRQMKQALDSCDSYQRALHEAGYGRITTEIRPADPFYYAEEYHQQYLAKNPARRCGHGGVGIAFPDLVG